MPYTPNPQHRNKAFSYQKSQWSISLPEEIQCYTTAQINSWLHKDAYWGLHLIKNNPPLIAPLGAPPLPNNDRLHIAKFVCDAIGNWHGYPVAHWISPFDKPGEAVVTDWCNMGHISRQAKSKIIRGKKCAL